MKSVEELVNKYKLMIIENSCQSKECSTTPIIRVSICRESDFTDRVIDNDESSIKDYVIDESIENGVRTWVKLFGETK